MSEEKTLSAAGQKILDAVEKLTIVELAELVEAMEEKFGVSAAAPVAVAGAAGGGDAAGGADEKSEYNLVLKDAGAAKIKVIKAIREITGLGLGEAKGIADAGGVVKEAMPKDDAEKAKAALEEAGATVELE